MPESSEGWRGGQKLTKTKPDPAHFNMYKSRLQNGEISKKKGVLNKKYIK